MRSYWAQDKTFAPTTARLILAAVLFVWFIIGVLVLAFAGSLIASTFRWLGRIILATLMAACAGFLLTMFASADVAQGWAIPLVVLLVFVVCLLALAPSRADQPFRRSVNRQAARSPSTGQIKRVKQVQDHWSQLAEAAPDHAARIAVARQSCERLLAGGKDRMFDMSAHESRVILEKRIPQLIRRDLQRAEALSPRQAERLLRELVEFLERVAADCERRLEGWKPSSGEPDDALRRRIETYLDISGGQRPV